MKDRIVPIMTATFSHVLRFGTMPPSWKDASISLIAKEGKDKLECSNYRPISGLNPSILHRVLNQDYKIFTHIISKRLENILPQIISLDRTGFIKKRQTQNNIRRTLHIIDKVGKNQEEML